MNSIVNNTGVPFDGIAATVFDRASSAVAIGLHPSTGAPVAVDLAAVGHLLVSPKDPGADATAVLRALAAQLLMNNARIGMFDPHDRLDVLRQMGVASGDGAAFRHQLENLAGIAASRRGDGPASALPQIRRALLINADTAQVIRQLDDQAAGWLEDILDCGADVGIHVIATVPYARLGDVAGFGATVICNPPNALGLNTGLLVLRANAATQLVNLPAATEDDVRRYGNRRRSPAATARPAAGQA